jgi:hypothetical protein
MADNQDPRYSGKDAPFLADDDPLAELARIVGYDVPEQRASTPGTRDTISESFDLDLDLEAELLSDLARDQQVAPEVSPPTPASAGEDQLTVEEIPDFLKTRASMPDTHSDEPVAADFADEIDAERMPMVDGAQDGGDERAALAAQDDADTSDLIHDDAHAGDVEPESPEAVMAEDWTDLPDWPPRRPDAAVRELDYPEAGAFADLLSGAEYSAVADDLSGRGDADDGPQQSPEAGSEETVPSTDGDILRETQRVEDDRTILGSHEDFDESDVGYVSEDELIAAGEQVSELAEPGDLRRPDSDLPTETVFEEQANDAHVATREPAPTAYEFASPEPEPDEDAEQTYDEASLPDEVAKADTAATITPPGTGADDRHVDLVLRDFERYAVPDRGLSPLLVDPPAFTPVTVGAASSNIAPYADRGPANDWDIADELERAFADLDGAGASPTPQPHGADDAEEHAADDHDALPVGRFFVDENTDIEDAVEPETHDLGIVAAPEEPTESTDWPDPVSEMESAGAQDDPHGDIDFDFDHFELEMEQASEALTDGLGDAEDQAFDAETEPQRHEEPDRGELAVDRADGVPTSMAVAATAAAAASFATGSRDLGNRSSDSTAAAAAVGVSDAPAHPGFDVRDVADTTDYVEPVQEIDVPDLPKTEDWHGVERVDDFDISEIEAEFADILSRGDMQNQPRRTKPVEPVTAASAAPIAAGAATPPRDDLDFEQIDFAEFDFGTLSETGGRAENAAVHQARAQSHDPRQDDLAFEDFRPPAPGQAVQKGAGLPKWPIAAAVLVAGGLFGAWMVWGGGNVSSGEPRVIAADDSPMKVVPEEPGGRAVPNQNQAVYEQVDGTRSNDVNLVSRSEEPVDVVQRTVDPQVLPLEGRPEPGQTASPPVSQDGPADVDAATGEADPFGSEIAETSEATTNDRLGVAPRRVQTMVVRSDGTLVPREEAPDNVAQTSPVTSDEALSASALIAAAEGGQATTLSPAGPEAVAAGAENGGVPLPQPRPEASAGNIAPGQETAERLLPDGQTTAEATDTNTAVAAPVRMVRTTALDGTGDPLPGDRPADQPVNIVGNASESQEQAQTTQEPAPASTPAAPEGQQPTQQAAGLAPAGQAIDNPGGYVMQIASQPTEEGARSTYQSLAQRYGSILGNRQAQIQAADIPDRGTFYRVRIAGGTREEATALCERYQAAGGSCFVAR